MGVSGENGENGGEHQGEPGYRGPQVTNIVGISYRQLDYWARTGLATPSIRSASGSGSQRLYSFEDLVRLKLIKRLLDTGVSLQRVREAIGHLHELGHDLHDVTLASDGRSIYACRSENEFYDLMRGGQGVFGIAIGPVMDEIEATVSQLRPADKATSDTQTTSGSPSMERAQGED